MAQIAKWRSSKVKQKAALQEKIPLIVEYAKIH